MRPCIRALAAAGSALKSARVHTRKRFGQHLLKNADVVANIVAAAHIQPHESVFEIGPGTGNMTVHLLKAASRVYAVELDRDMHRTVCARVEGMGLSDKFECVCGDFLRTPLPAFDALVANIPYQISSPVLTRLFALRPLPSRAIIMFQLEFAQRMVARPGSSQYCRLSVNTELLSDSKLIMHIGRNQFRPPPKVDSAVVEIIPRLPPADLDFPQWDSFLRLAFSGKNKTLRANITGNKSYIAQLARWRSGAQETPSASASTDALVRTSMGNVHQTQFDATKADLQRILDSVGAAGKRPNALPLAEFRAIFDALYTGGFRFLSPNIAPTASESIPEIESADE